MITLINKQSGNRYMCLDHSLREGRDSWYDRKNNMSFPKTDWELLAEGEPDHIKKRTYNYTHWPKSSGSRTSDNSTESD